MDEIKERIRSELASMHMDGFSFTKEEIEIMRKAAEGKLTVKEALNKIIDIEIRRA